MNILHQSLTVSDDTLQTLHALLPDNLIIAALDLIDRGRGQPDPQNRSRFSP